MHLYLIRHADALDGEDDAARPLSPKGRKQIGAVARLLREARAFEAGEIWHSPLRRAQETALLLAQELKGQIRLEAVAGLTPEDPVDQIAAKLDDLRRPVALVGHEPHLSALASLLVVGQATPPHFIMKKCSVLRLDRTEGGWSVRWHVSPELV
jgi:phosphohistidine phosphatase